jgi:hypothetical protein
MLPFVQVFFFNSQEFAYTMPSVPHTGSSSDADGGHERGQFDDMALVSLLLLMSFIFIARGNGSVKA